MQPQIDFPIFKHRVAIRKGLHEDGCDDMNPRLQPQPQPQPQSSLPSQIYPRRYFDAAATWFRWNKLTAADVHALRAEPGFEGQNIYFYLTHPIRFVRIVGVVVEISVTAGGRYTLLTLDDGSNACINVKVTRRTLAVDDHAQYPSNTMVDNLDVHMVLGLPQIFIDRHHAVDVGTVIKAQGTIAVFWKVRQIELQRVWIVKDTTAEVVAWADVAKWKRDVLSKPWVLTQSQRDGIDEHLRLEERTEREKARRREAREMRSGQKHRRHEEKREVRRCAEEQRLNEGAWRGSHLIAAPWD